VNLSFLVLYDRSRVDGRSKSKSGAMQSLGRLSKGKTF
jgi:hypothetical protein